MSNGSSGIGVVATTPGDTEQHSGHIATRMMVSVFLEVHSEIHIFTRSTAVMEFDNPAVHLHKYKKPYPNADLPLRLFGQLIYQLRICLGICRHREFLDLILISSSGTILPILVSKLCEIFTVYRVGGAYYLQISPSTHSENVWRKFLKSVEKTIYTLSDMIIIISPTLADFVDLDRAQGKTYVWNHYYFDTEKFDISVDFDSRESVVGHVGVSEVKGTVRFLDAMSSVDEHIIDKILILGKGHQMKEARKATADLNIDVEFTGHISRSKMPEKYNEMRLLVICSESEGVPKVAFEAMACGTPVLANKVGGIPDHIQDHKDGYLIEDNDPETIATAIQAVLLNKELSDTSGRARDTIEQGLSLDRTVEKYQELVHKHSPIEL